jgi:hypothetical protein
VNPVFPASKSPLTTRFADAKLASPAAMSETASDYFMRETLATIVKEMRKKF